MEWNESHFLINMKDLCYVSRDSDWSINYSIKGVSEWLSGWMSKCAWLIEWVSGPVSAWY